MARLIVVYDPNGTIMPIPDDIASQRGTAQAMLDIADDQSRMDIYRLAEKLATMLLEQL